MLKNLSIGTDEFLVLAGMTCVRYRSVTTYFNVEVAGK